MNSRLTPLAAEVKQLRKDTGQSMEHCKSVIHKCLLKNAIVKDIEDKDLRRILYAILERT